MLTVREVRAMRASMTLESFCAQLGPFVLIQKPPDAVEAARAMELAAKGTVFIPRGRRGVDGMSLLFEFEELELASLPPMGNAEILSIGRLPDNELVVDHTSVSKRHAQVRWAQSRCMVMDLGSTNGTLVNDALITAPVELKDGDIVTFGEVRFGFLLTPSLYRVMSRPPAQRSSSGTSHPAPPGPSAPAPSPAVPPAPETPLPRTAAAQASAPATLTQPIPAQALAQSKSLAAQPPGPTPPLGPGPLGAAPVRAGTQTPAAGAPSLAGRPPGVTPPLGRPAPPELQRTPSGAGHPAASARAHTPVALPTRTPGTTPPPQTRPPASSSAQATPPPTLAPSAAPIPGPLLREDVEDLEKTDPRGAAPDAPAQLPHISRSRLMERTQVVPVLTAAPSLSAAIPPSSDTPGPPASPSPTPARSADSGQPPQPIPVNTRVERRGKPARSRDPGAQPAPEDAADEPTAPGKPFKPKKR